MLLSTLVEASAAVTATRSRKAKVAALAAALRRADPDEVAIATAYLSGSLTQRRTGVGWRGLSTLPAPADTATLTVRETDAAFETIAALEGPGSQQRRAQAVTDLFARATGAEQGYLVGLVSGNLRQGALDGLVLEAIAAAADLPAEAVRRAVMFRGAAGPVAEAALRDGAQGLAGFGLRVGRPVRPMLASSAADIGEAFTKAGGGRLAVDCKLDGIRIQVHKDATTVRVFTRSLDEITDRVPEVVEAVTALPARSLVLDGEAIALSADGRPRPFQETGSRTASRGDPELLRATTPLTAYFFDVLHVDGEELVDAPGHTRLSRLAEALPADLIVPRLTTADPAEAERWFRDLVAAGHEGVVVKSLDAPYEAGRRGSGWVKVKPRHTLDLVVLAVEWGSGRRRGTLSNIHLGALDPQTGGFVMLGKTFKGMTDQMLAWQTRRFSELAVAGTDDWVVRVRPEQVVEVAFDGVQTSSRYPGGIALRFARVLRYRDDKGPQDADTIETVRSLRP